MIGTRFLAMAALLLAASATLAQPAGAGDTAPVPADQSPAPAAGDGDDSGDKPARAARSPSDYRASEEISEDLPVSFPVDI